MDKAQEPSNSGCIKVFVKITEGKRSFVKPRLKLEDRIKNDLKGIGCERVGLSPPAQDRYQCRALLNKVINHYMLGI
jgi:hypothetical protein